MLLELWNHRVFVARQREFPISFSRNEVILHLGPFEVVIEPRLRSAGSDTDIGSLRTEVFVAPRPSEGRLISAVGQTWSPMGHCD